MLQDISDLIVDCEDFATVSNRAQKFCPFEAIGMVRQEIRHSSFLCYLMDPSRPHGLGEIGLRALLMVLARDDPAEKLDFHFRDLGQAQLWRERYNIDILIEVPRAQGKGLVIAIELKVDAAERQGQLSDYAGLLSARYDDSRWKRVHCFLTPDGRAGSTHGATTWINVAMGDLLSRIGEGIERAGEVGEASQLFEHYLNMMKRHNIVADDSDPDLMKAVQEVWRKHKEALDFLMEHRPDPLAELWDEFKGRQEEVAQQLSGSAGVDISPDTHQHRICRFSLSGLRAQCPDLFLGGGDWLSSGGQCAIEVTLRKEVIVASFVVGPPGKQPGFREILAEGLDRRSKQRKAGLKYSHYFEEEVASWEALYSVESKFKTFAEELASYVTAKAPQVIAAIQEAQRQFAGQ